MPTNQLNRNLPILFGKRFLEDHVGYLVSEPNLAVIELIANSYDAGATIVRIQTPSESGQVFSISDDGIGMTRKDFEGRWSKLAYNRQDEQGDKVIFPPGVSGLHRKPLGHTGKGRHGAFCFADSYRIETHKGGEHTSAEVRLIRGEREPFKVTPSDLAGGPNHGTTVTATATRNFVVSSVLAEQIGSKFLVDPSFRIILNGKEIDLFALNIIESFEVPLSNSQNHLMIHQIVPRDTDRDAQMRGVTWWVRKRMVGSPSWQSFSGETYLDARRAEAKRFSFVIEADSLKDSVKDDWSGFHACKTVTDALNKADERISSELHTLLASQRKESKANAIKLNSRLVGSLPQISRAAVGMFVDEVQKKCASLTERDLAKTVEIYATLEQSKSGYDLLNQLAECSPQDLDTWNELMTRWTANNAQIVLGELQKRLSLIDRVSKLLALPKTDELHEIHPLIEQGLWMFGPEYESVDFRSNRGMTEVIGNFFGRKGKAVTRRRIDIVAISHSTIGAYSAPAFTMNQEMAGYRSVLLLELKATGIPITLTEIDQARDYCDELYNTGAVSESVPIRAYVIGSALEAKREGRYGNATITPRRYHEVLESAHIRTFNLQRRLESEGNHPVEDSTVEAVIVKNESVFQGQQ